MKIKDYSIIENEWIDGEIIYQEKRLNAIKKAIDEDWKGKYDYEHSLEIENAKAKLNILKSIKSKLKPLTEIVENALDAGKLSEQNAYLSSGIDRKQDYINNTEV